MNIYEKAKIQSDLFIEKNILNYSKFRNYDFGPNQRTNVSSLSPFFSHRILLEYDIINKILN